MEAREATAPGPWDNINAVWTKDRGRTWDDLRPPPTAREAQGPDDKAQPGNRPDAVPEWAAADRADATGPQPAVTLFRPRGKMAIRCENKCTWCDEQCYQARNFRYGGHVGRCLCPKSTRRWPSHRQRRNTFAARPTRSSSGETTTATTVDVRSPPTRSGRTGAPGTGLRATKRREHRDGTAGAGAAPNGGKSTPARENRNRLKPRDKRSTPRKGMHRTSRIAVDKRTPRTRPQTTDRTRPNQTGQTTTSVISHRRARPTSQGQRRPQKGMTALPDRLQHRTSPMRQSHTNAVKGKGQPGRTTGARANAITTRLRRRTKRRGK